MHHTARALLTAFMLQRLTIGPRTFPLPKARLAVRNCPMLVVICQKDAASTTTIMWGRNCPYVQSRNRNRDMLKIIRECEFVNVSLKSALAIVGYSCTLRRPPIWHITVCASILDSLAADTIRRWRNKTTNFWISIRSFVHWPPHPIIIFLIFVRTGEWTNAIHDTWWSMCWW